MKRWYNYVEHLDVTAECLFPFRTGNSENDIETVLKNEEGQFFIGGTSIAGAFRDFCEKVDRKVADSIFGSQETEGSLVVSDGIFSKATLCLRPRLAIDFQTGEGKQGGKFDMAHLEKGSIFSFTLTYFAQVEEGNQASKENIEKEIALVIGCLTALNQGNIAFGGQKHNGFGQVSLKVKRKTLDLRKEADRALWLSNHLEGVNFSLPSKLSPLFSEASVEKISFHLKGHMKQVMVKSGETQDYTAHMREAGVPVIPASSIRGVIRHRMTAISQFLQVEDGFVDNLFGTHENQEHLPQAGVLFFQDCYLKEGKTQKIKRIRINKFTGGVIPHALFTEEPFGSEVSCVVKLDSGFSQQEKACGLLLFALRDVALGLVTLGSGASIGRGVVEVDEISIHRGDTLLGKLVVESQDSTGKPTQIDIEDSSGELARFLSAIGGVTS